jgi:hypothetical protein
MFGLSALSRVTLGLSGLLAGFQRPNLDMSGPQPGHVRTISLIPGYPSLIRLLSWVPEIVVGHVWPRPGHVWLSATQRLDSLGEL